MEVVNNPMNEFYDQFCRLSYDTLKVKIAAIRKQKHDARIYLCKRKQELRDAQAKARRIRNTEKRKWLSQAKSIFEVDFIAKAKPDFWQWLEKVRQCPHIHLDVTPGSHAVEPFYNCRWCGATVACSCRYPANAVINGRSDHWARRESTYNDLFRDIFVRPGICYRCRKDESLGAAYQYGKDRIERLFWRELLQEEGNVWLEIQQPDYDSLDQIIRASSWKGPKCKWGFASVILTRDAGGLIHRVLERALRIKKILRKAGRQETIKNILIDFVKSYCRLQNSVNNLYALEDDLVDDDGIPFDYKDMPYTLHLPSSYGNQEMWQSYDLEKHPEKAMDMPYPFQLALLSEFIKEEPLPILCDTRRVAKERLAPLLDDYDAVHDFAWAIEAVKLQDIGLFLKMLVQSWAKDRSVLETRKDEFLRNLKERRLFWAIWEYDQYVSGNYSGFENRIKKDVGLRKWLLSSLELPDVDSFLNNGDIITNVVGMSHIPWHAYLDLDRYIGKGGFYLLREPDNPSDANAVMVYLEGFGETGYIKRSLAGILAPLMDRGVEIGAELFARHYPHSDLDMTLHLRLKQSTAPLKPPETAKKYKKRPQKKQKSVVVKQDSDQERAPR